MVTKKYMYFYTIENHQGCKKVFENIEEIEDMKLF